MNKVDIETKIDSAREENKLSNERHPIDRRNTVVVPKDSLWKRIKNLFTNK